MTPKINVLLGTKAEMIKVAPVLRELEKRGFSYRLIETGQHGAYLNRLREEFEIREPDIRLGKNRDVDNFFEVFHLNIKIYSMRKIKKSYGFYVPAKS